MALAPNRTAPEPQIFLPPSVIHRSPTCTVSALRGILSASNKTALHLIEAGKLEWAWNIAARDAQRAELRILALSVHDFQHGLVRCLAWSDVIRLLYGQQREGIHASHFYRAWACSPNHFYALLDEGGMEPLKPRWRRGVAGGASVTWESTVAFAKRCRVT